MIVDTSAVIAILHNEPEAPAFATAVISANAPKMSAAAYVEAALVCDRDQDPVLSARLDQLLRQLGITVMALTPSQAQLARRAFQQFGKGMGHKAQLNYGDCMTYALAKESAEPLLFKGGDFRHTDLLAVI